MAEKTIARILLKLLEKMESYHDDIDQGEDVGHAAGATSGGWSFSVSGLLCRDSFPS